MAVKKQALWKCTNRRNGFEPIGRLEAFWEVSNDPISDEYTPQEINATELFHMWSGKVDKLYPNGLIPIYWFVEYEGDVVRTLEAMPFQYDHHPRYKQENFLSFFTWPVNAETEEPLNWFSIPVKDKLWEGKKANKGGFIQQATGWKPSILQPFVYLPSLLKSIKS